MNERENDEEEPNMNANIRRTLAERQRGIMQAHGRLARALGLNTEKQEDENDGR